MPSWRIPLSDLDYGPREQAAVRRVLRSRWLSMGPEVAAFEKEFAAFVGVKHAIAVANATAGLHLAYLALGLGPGDEIIQPAVNFVAAANMTVATGARPIFGDIIGLAEPTLDPAEIERRLTRRTRAVIVMHYGGHLCRMEEISALCRRHRLILIEDACHGHFGAVDFSSRPPGRKVGSLGDIGCFSFSGNKNLATGEGGMVTTDRDDWAGRNSPAALAWEDDLDLGPASGTRELLRREPARPYNVSAGRIACRAGTSPAGEAPRNNRRRKKLAELYRRRLAGPAGLDSSCFSTGRRRLRASPHGRGRAR